jgi:hyperosmotically inducible periplasmic protein
MLRSLLRAVVLIIVVVAAAAFLLGWWGNSKAKSGEPQSVGTTGVSTERAREVGAQVGERTAAAAEQARRALANGGITAKIKAKMALDDTVKALDVNVDTGGTIVTVAGTVDTPAQRERVLQLARETQGVTQVIDRLTVKR